MTITPVRGKLRNLSVCLWRKINDNNIRETLFMREICFVSSFFYLIIRQKYSANDLFSLCYLLYSRGSEEMFEL